MYKVLCFKEILEDIKLECEKYGKVNKIYMPRKDIEENDVAWMGNAYVLFYNIDDVKMLEEIYVVEDLMIG